MTLAGLHVAIVDDEVSVRRALERLLVILGCRVSTYASGESFLAALPADVCDCVLLDVRMPKVTGFDVHKHLAQRWPAVPVLFMTGQTDEATLDRARLVGDGLVFKPFDEGAMVDAILGVVSRGVKH
jgi:FixJ family two-component response regulator